MRRIIIMAKSPAAGQVKTRLMDALTTEETINLHRAMIDTTIKNASRACSDIWLATDDLTESSIIAFMDRFDIQGHLQCQGDLGERLKDIMRKSFNLDKKHVLIIGSDSPHVSHQRYVDAFNALDDGYDVVIGPVEDGGYDLIATKKNTAELFEGITWSSSIVLSQTLKQCDKLNLSVKLLETSFDIDRPEDLMRAPAHTWDTFNLT